MAATLTVQKTVTVGEYAIDFFTIAMDSTYPSGGEAIDATGDLGYFAVNFDGPSTNGYTAKWVASSQKIKVFYGDYSNASDGPMVENATADISAETFTGQGWRVK